jgi:peptide/nickel transport system permease protein
MIKVLIKKGLMSLLTIFVATILTFLLIRSMPGDPIESRARELQMTQGITYKMAYELAKEHYNYDPEVPIHLQFYKYLKGLMRGNLGNSIVYDIPVTTIIFTALPWTLFIVTLSLITSFILGCTGGLVMAWKRKSKTLDFVTTLFSVLTQSVPDFLIALILLVILGVHYQLFPLRGAYSVSSIPGWNLQFILDVLYHAVLPVASFTIFTMGGWALSMKGSATSVMTEDYIHVARAKGLKEKRILVNYLGRNAVVPLITGLAVSFGTMISGAMFIENIFSYPGIGYFFGLSIGARDFTLMQGLLLLTTITIVVANLVADLIHCLLDPRVGMEQ